MKKLVTNIAFIGFLGLFSINSSSQNVAVVDVELALLASQEVQDARKALSEEPEFAALIEEAEQLQIELQNLIEKSQKDEEIMSDDEKAELAKEFEEKSTDYEFLMGKIQTIKAIRDMIRPQYGMNALRKAKEVSETSVNQSIIIVEHRK